MEIRIHPNSYDIENPIEVCPACNHAVHLTTQTHTPFIHRDGQKFVAAVHQCPRTVCSEFSFAYYILNIYKLNLVASYPYRKPENKFSDDIQKTSPNFVETYLQAATAKELGLDQVCGPGFRKALEFLVKDYLITIKGKDGEVIKKKQLQNCIQEDFEDGRIKEIAERCTWLGNDETHYHRRWVTKDIEDLIKITQLVVYHIDSDIYGGRLVGEMPKPEKKKK